MQGHSCSFSGYFVWKYSDSFVGRVYLVVIHQVICISNSLIHVICKFCLVWSKVKVSFFFVIPCSTPSPPPLPGFIVNAMGCHYFYEYIAFRLCITLSTSQILPWSCILWINKIARSFFGAIVFSKVLPHAEHCYFKSFSPETSNCPSSPLRFAASFCKLSYRHLLRQRSVIEVYQEEELVLSSRFRFLIFCFWNNVWKFWKRRWSLHFTVFEKSFCRITQKVFWKLNNAATSLRWKSE